MVIRVAVLELSFLKHSDLSAGWAIFLNNKY